MVSHDPSEDWRQTVLVLLDGRMYPARLPWNNADEIVPLIHRAMGDQRQELYGAHHVRHRPHPNGNGTAPIHVPPADFGRHGDL